MDDRARVTLSTCVGAVVGAIAGFLLFTERGRRVRGEITTQLSAFVEDLRRLQAGAESSDESGGGGWHVLSSLLAHLGRRTVQPTEPTGEADAGPPPRFH